MCTAAFELVGEPLQFGTKHRKADLPNEAAKHRQAALAVLGIVETAIAKGWKQNWLLEEVQAGVPTARVYFDSEYRDLEVHSRIADVPTVFGEEGVTVRVRWQYDGQQDRLFRASQNILLDTELAQRYLEAHCVPHGVFASTYHQQVANRYERQSCGRQEFMSRKQFHLVAAGFFDSQYEYGDFYIERLDDCVECKRGEWNVLICDGSLRFRFLASKCCAPDITTASEAFSGGPRRVGSRLQRCLQQLPLDPDPFKANPIPLEILHKVEELGKCLVQLQLSESAVGPQDVVQATIPGLAHACKPLSDLVTLLQAQARTVNAKNRNLLRWGGKLIMFLSTHDAVSITINCQQAESDGALRTVLDTVIKKPDTVTRPFNFVSASGKVVDIDANAVKRLSNALSKHSAAMKICWAKVPAELLRAVIQRHTDNPSEATLQEVSTVVSFLHYACLCAMRSSPVAWDGSYVYDYVIPPQTDEESKKMVQKHWNGPTSKERQDYQRASAVGSSAFCGAALPSHPASLTPYRPCSSEGWDFCALRPDPPPTKV